MSLYKYSDYMDSDYTPGELARRSVSQYNLTPMKEQELIAKMRYNNKIRPEPVDPFKTKDFEEFMLLSRNPGAFFQSKIDLPEDFVRFSNFAGNF